MPEKILRTEYSEEMQKSYLDDSMSVITARAVPDIRDGLMDLVLIRNVHRWQIPFYLPGLMMSRDLKFKITRHRKVSEVLIEGKDLRINIDGDIISLSRAEFRIRPASLSLIR